MLVLSLIIQEISGFALAGASILCLLIPAGLG